ncbi:class I SAM-dependent methyltransferase [Bacillus canaveralius]|uniref:Class I SAM-dependent methyltransferase n=1 Tax=Bacillus canaveralius TaxID=1403243 RepID=A0A2N5GMC7_9BACI|nr:MULTISPECIES: class I SAM-dependent methyltransferase [Bacillus]PLR82981.1 class I SAM-dependent methyltransferase [Bacillus canaveralius]PLR87941.1 class I SAM-dependent methyltransferase [Bacillus sp. V33-4]PLR97015.1 class I SAM-dependent methyltransferase [Bacillus canaveralius]RSK47909.1 class I SAM-dependent methyltransferase [Bacillus canaveralius]
MQLSPRIYHSFVRPKWITKVYIQNKLQRQFDFTDKKVLDFGAGTGANCTLFSPVHYFGIDPDTHRINFAKRFYAKYRFEAFEGHKLPVDDNSFDFVLIIAVLHHIPPEAIENYIKEFKRILKPEGKVVVIEPCFFEKSPISNWFMRSNDKGDYIQKEEDYLNYFTKENFKCNVLNRFKKCFVYNELYFTALL